jgi:hypothetical protein
MKQISTKENKKIQKKKNKTKTKYYPLNDIDRVFNLH